ncbi:hypothetical protein TNCV_2500201 [Trichonephila clavipes]|nr:hypothetical protein TNCV_2500201 [Trichonephila clavipes]
MSHRKPRSVFDQVSECDGVTYRDCGLSFRKISSRVERNQTTVMRICDRGRRRVRRTEVVDRIHLSASLHSGTGCHGMGGIGYNSRTHLVRIAGTLNSQRYTSEVLEPVVLPYLQGLATAVF